MFLLAAKQLGINVKDCVGIEDSQAGIDALNSGNIDSIAIGNQLKGATITLNDTSELTLDIIDY